MMKTTFIILFLIYLVAMGVLGVKGLKKTKDMKSFAVSSGDVNPYIVAITWAATFMSAGTFLGLPGLAYKNGVSLLWYHMGHWFPAILMLALVAGSYRKLANKTNALTMPDWLADVYQSKGLRLLIGIVCLCNIVPLAAQFVGVGTLMNATLGIPYDVGVLIGVVVVMIYLFLGGTYAHIYTNVVQGTLMCIVSIVVVVTGFVLFGNVFTEVPRMLTEIDPNLSSTFNPSDAAFAGPVAIAGIFISNACWSLNPQLMNKVQYLKTNRDLKKFILFAGFCLFIGGMVIVGGLYSRILTPDTLANADDALPTFVKMVYHPVVGAFFNVVLLAATMSTTDGVMVMLATVLGNTLYRQTYIQHKIDCGQKVDVEKADKNSLAIAKWSVVLVGLASLPIAFNRPSSLNVLNWIGTGVILSAVAGPLLVAVTQKKVHKLSAVVSAVCGISSYLIVYVGKLVLSVYLSVGIGCVVSLAVAFIVNWWMIHQNADQAVQLRD